MVDIRIKCLPETDFERTKRFAGGFGTGADVKRPPIDEKRSVRFAGGFGTGEDAFSMRRRLLVLILPGKD